MNAHPITTPASPSLASPLFDALFDSIESLTTSVTSPVVPTIETTTITEVALGYHRNQNCDEAEGIEDSFTYYESWPVPKKGAKLPKVIDTAAFSYGKASFGSYKQKGTIGFYCEETILSNGGAPKWRPGQNVVINQGSRCKTTSGSLDLFINTSGNPD